MRGLIPAVLAASVALAGPAVAQDLNLKAAPLPTIAASPMAEVTFPDRPFPLKDDGTYGGFMQDVAKGMGRTCGALEVYGWEFPKAKQQEYLDRVFPTTMQAFADAGYKVEQVKPKGLPDPEMVTFTADKDPRKLLMLWVPVPEAAMLLMCDGARK